jgi:hypothetical protein
VRVTLPDHTNPSSKQKPFSRSLLVFHYLSLCIGVFVYFVTMSAAKLAEVVDTGDPTEMFELVQEIGKVSFGAVVYSSHVYHQRGNSVV